MAESIHEKLKRVRPPRVNISMSVETEGAEPKNDLPFVVGVLGDFSGDPTTELKPLEERKFVSIDRDNINDVMKKMTPGLNMVVENTLTGEGGEFSVQLKFESMDDFGPASVVKQVEPLRKLLETRNKLRDLISRVERSKDLDKIMAQVLRNKDELNKLCSDLGISDIEGQKKEGE